MRSLTVILACLAWFACATLLTAQAPSPEAEAIESLAMFYERHNSAALAQQLREGYKNRTVVFGEVDGGDNAMYDHRRQIMTINRRLPEKLLQQELGKGYAVKAGAAMTVAHEFEHARQSWFAWHLSVASERLGNGNRSEQDAWRRGFEAGAEWIREKKRELDRLIAEDKPHQERARAAVELRDLCKTWSIYANDYASMRGNIGEVVVSNPALPAGEERGDPTTLQGQVEQLEKEAAGILRIAQQMTMSFDGDYRGKVAGINLSGEVRFAIRNFEARGTVRGVKGESTVSAVIQGTVDPEGRLTLTLRDAKMKETVQGKDFESLLGGSASGFVNNKTGAARGTWRTWLRSNPDLVLGQDDGTWEAQRQ